MAQITRQQVGIGVRPQPAWYARPVAYTTQNLGINYPWLNASDITWINTNWNQTKVFADLDAAKAMNVKKIRAWVTVDALYPFDGTNYGAINSTYAANVDSFLNYAATDGLSVIIVMADGNSQTQPASYNGKVQWSLFQSQAGIAKYAALFTDYVARFRSHTNILAWEIMNEPYGSGTNSGFSAYATSLGITNTQVHTWLQTMYATVKGGDNFQRPVMFSDYEEEEQTKYQVFSSASFRAQWVDDCTDVYSMHIYRPSAANMADFRNVTGKPKWLSEVGNINYSDPTGASHNNFPGHNELYSPSNAPAVRDLMTKALNSGFSLCMPWSLADNQYIVDYSTGNPILTDLGLWIKSALYGK